ncbi:MAG: 16S rRNA (cytidine(1402)-2'-O)-methyltransferase [Clostridiales bacterium]|jgi:16S rRNA (cytidine1402-2'-O)-methyltransferase|nr:16S rRNA (cytidine(1402)-2'-O)-methyltransferase [Clostridiales bacterium]
MSGTLFVCGTPLGNLEDISARALRILAEADVIACEDTRRTLKLLNYFGINNSSRPAAVLLSYHEHNKRARGKDVIKLLLEGKNVALVTDAGMPAISDPGEDLVNLCYENGLNVTVVPGPSAVVAALALCGLPARRFIFEGFLPREGKERARIVDSLRAEQRAVVFYEAPHRLSQTLGELCAALGERRAALVRELTKKHEEVRRGSLPELTRYFETNEPRGEYVIIVQGISAQEAEINSREKWKDITVMEHVEMYESQGLSRKDAIKRAAADRGVAKSAVYGEVHGVKESEGLGKA